MATRVFVSGTFAVGDVVEPALDDQRKLRVVLRAVDGDEVVVADSSGKRFAGVVALHERSVRVRLEAELETPAAPALSIVLAQGLPKGQKMEFVVEKATELGVARIVPFASERTAGDSARTGKVERWRRIAKSAAEQCGRHDVPQIEEPLAFDALLERIARAPLALVPWELADPQPLHARLPALIDGQREVLVAIGPEGGFSDAETQAARAAGAHVISLGRRILRTETAGLVVTAALLYVSGDL
jgi:16S rRNA (uracil1498-N3)-methyltransferase